MGTLGHSYDGILSKSMGCNETNEISWMKIKMPHHGFANGDRFFWCLQCQLSTKKILLPGSGLGPRPVKDIKTEGTWTAIQVEFLNMRILDKWMLISIVFSGDGEVPAHDFPVETFFFPLPSPPLGLSPTSQLWTLALGLFGDRFRWVVAHFSTDYI